MSRAEISVEQLELVRAILENSEQCAALAQIVGNEAEAWKARAINEALGLPAHDPVDKLLRISEAAARARQLEDVIPLLQRKVYRQP